MKPISIINKLNESADVCSDEFKERLRNIFGNNIKDDTEYGGCIIGNTGIAISNMVDDINGEPTKGVRFYPVDSESLIPDIDKGGILDIMAPRFIKGQDGTEYGDTYSIEGDLSDEEIKDMCNELSSKIVHLKKGVRDNNGYGVIDEGADSSNKYHYITSANNPDDIGAEYVYNSYSNTEVEDILNELVRYFTQAQKDAKEIIAKATHDPGVYDSDVKMCKFCAEKAQEMLDKMHSTWE